ncbi:MAG: hypothetical protein QW420_06145 [Candidatus Caldarchaeum sp.]
MTSVQAKLAGLAPGSRIIVTWLDASEIRKRSHISELVDDDALTVIQTVGVFLYVHTSPFYPDIPHLIVYEGVREGKHVYTSIPLPLIVSIEVEKRARREVKRSRFVHHILSPAGGVKSFLHEKSR